MAEHKPDVVLLDVELPDAQGLELLEEIRTTHPAMHIVMMTANRDVENIVGAMRLGAVDYVAKPFDRTRVVTATKNAVERPRPAGLRRLLAVELVGISITRPGHAPARRTWGRPRASCRGAVSGAAWASGCGVAWGWGTLRPRPHWGVRAPRRAGREARHRSL